MRTQRVTFAIAAIAALVSLTQVTGDRARRGSLQSPFLKWGPQAMRANASGPSYGLFQCQAGLVPGVICYDPYQVRHAYHIDALLNAGLDGRGKTIVIVDSFQSPNLVAALNAYNGFYGIPSLNGLGGAPNPSLGTFKQVAPDGLTPFDPSNADMSGWAGEITLDVEWAHAIAPGANITLVLAKSDHDADILSATQYAVDHRLGDVVSQSFGENESCMDPALVAKQHQIFTEATLKFMTVLASSGDFGSGQLTCDASSLTQAVSTPASDPLVTAVGGTELHAADYCLTALGCNPATKPAPGTYQGEIAWNEPDFGASGGGFSVLYGLPFYQKLLVHNKQLGVPDVSYSAAVLHGLLTYVDIPGVPGSPGFFLFGGTSAGSPQWAALVAIADQKTSFDLGFINMGLYRMGLSPKSYSTSFLDVTSGNNAFGGVPGFSAGPGWDPTTGLGSPNADQLVENLIHTVTPADGLIEIAESLLNPHGKSPWPGHMGPH